MNNKAEVMTRIAAAQIQHSGNANIETVEKLADMILSRAHTSPHKEVHATDVCVTLREDTGIIAYLTNATMGKVRPNLKIKIGS